jgi:effector-binding domain-containing protein
MSSESEHVTQAADPEYSIGEMRVQTMRGCEFFHVGVETTMAGMGEAIGRVMPRLFEAQREGRVVSAGPVVFVYTGGDATSPFLLEMGFPVAAGTAPVSEAKVRRLDDFHCASLVYCGALKHLGKAYDALGRAVERAGLKHSGEMREYYLYFEDDDSPNNVTLLQYRIEEGGS